MARTGVVHFEHNGVGVILSEALRRQGYRSTVVASAPHPFGFKEDILLPQQAGVLGDALRLSVWLRLRNYAVFHNHAEFLPGVSRRLWAGRIVQHYHDRVVDTPIAGADISLVSMPGNLRTIPSATWLPLPVRTSVFLPVESRSSGPVRIGFCTDTSDPMKPALIPTEEIAAAIARSGVKAQAFPLKGLAYDHSRIREYYSEIDVWVDRIGVGFYGLSAIEAASMGIPIVTEIGEFEADMVPGCPFMSVDREGVRDAVETLVHDNAARDAVGQACREFAVKVHDADAIASRLAGMYQRLL